MLLFILAEWLIVVVAATASRNYRLHITGKRCAKARYVYKGD